MRGEEEEEENVDLVAAEEDIAKAEKAVPPGDALAASEVAVWRYRIERPHPYVRRRARGAVRLRGRG